MTLWLLSDSLFTLPTAVMGWAGCRDNGWHWSRYVGTIYLISHGQLGVREHTGPRGDKQITLAPTFLLHSPVFRTLQEAL